MAINLIELDGLIEAQKALRKAAGTPAAAKALNLHIVETELIPPSKTFAPVRSGRLRDSIIADASPQYGYIVAGKKWGLKYASVIHFGWATRGIGRGKLKGGVTARRRQLLEANAKLADSGISDKALKRAGTRSLERRRKDGTLIRHAVRGGPIKPNPFVYEAIDARHMDVMWAYDAAIETRYRLEGLL